MRSSPYTVLHTVPPKPISDSGGLGLSGLAGSVGDGALTFGVVPFLKSMHAAQEQCSQLIPQWPYFEQQGFPLPASHCAGRVPSGAVKTDPSRPVPQRSSARHFCAEMIATKLVSASDRNATGIGALPGCSR